MIVNGVTLPDIPDEVLAQFPYAVITANYIPKYDATAYSLNVSEQPFDHLSQTFVGQEALLTHGAGQVLVASASDSAWDATGSSPQSPLIVMLGSTTGATGNAIEVSMAWTNHEIKEILWIDFDNMEWGTEPKEPKPPRYSIATAILDAVARQIMRLTDSTDKVKPEEFEEKLSAVGTGTPIASAEEGTFGTVSPAENAEKGFESSDSGSNTALSNTTVGYRFTANTAFTIIGFRGYASYQSSTVKLYNSNGELVTSKSVPSGTELWGEVYLDEPIAVSEGETYTVCSLRGTVRFIPKGSCTFNEKLSDIALVRKSGDVFPDLTASGVGYADIIIGQTTGDAPNEYIIQRTSMDGIADEVRRITSTTGKLSISQIITALNGIPVQTASTEE